MTENYEGELEDLRKKVELYSYIFLHSFLADKVGDVYFVCGELGDKDFAGLPDKLLVSPAYGSGWFQVYEKTDITGGH
jgi:hypothetical protein